MKWWEYLAVIASISAIIQFVNWLLNALLGNRSDGSLIILLSFIFVILLVILLILNRIREQQIKIKNFLKTKGFKEIEDVKNIK